MLKKIIIPFLSCFIISCTHSKEKEDLCLNYHEIKDKNEDVKSNDVNIKNHDIASFVRENDLYLNYNFKIMSKRYQNLKSFYMKFKVLESLPSDFGFDNGTLFNNYIKDNSNHQSELEVGVTGQGLNSNYYSSSNSVPNDSQLIENINNTIQDQLLVILDKKVNEKEVNELISEFMVKGNCLKDKKNIEVIVENNFNDTHIILESNTENFIKQSSSSFFSFNIYYAKKTDKKYEKSLYW